MNPNGTLYVMVVDNTTTPVSLASMCDKTQAYVQKLITDVPSGANGTIRCVGVVLNPKTTYTPTTTGSLDDDVVAAIPNAQALCDAAFAANYPLDLVLIERRSFNGTASGAIDMTTKASGNVAVVIAQDPAIAAIHAIHHAHASVGTCLGTVSLRDVAEDIGQVGTPGEADSGDISSASPSAFASVNLSSYLAVNSYSATDLTTLTTKGYIFAMTYAGYPGVYWNSSATCTSASSDFCTIENNRTLNKAARLGYLGLMPTVKKKLKTNPDGTLAETARMALQSLFVSSCQPMVTADEVAEVNAYIDPTQNVVANNGFNVIFNFGAEAIASNINVSIGFSS